MDEHCFRSSTGSATTTSLNLGVDDDWHRYRTREFDRSIAYELHGAWRCYYATEVPASMSRELLQRAIGYKIQEEAFGGLNCRTLLRLKALAVDRETGRGRTANRSLHAPHFEVWHKADPGMARTSA